VQATERTECIGTIGAVTVGDVFVPDGKACRLDGTKVTGGVTVGAGSALETSRADIHDSLTLNSSGRVLSDATIVQGDLVSTGTGIISLTNSMVVQQVTVQQNTTFSATGLVVGGNLKGTEVNRFDLTDGFVGGSFAADGAFGGSRFCGNKVFGNAEIRNSGAAIEIGGSGSCAGNRFYENVTVQGNVADITISNNNIRRDLNCVNNDPAPHGTGNTVTGGKLGQCATL
jgi:hypothetical protein